MSTPRFCDMCGVSLIPLTTPHVERPCDECGRPTYVIEPGDDGKGIRIRKGDRLTFPAGSIKISLDPTAGTGRLFKPGVAWLVSELLTAEIPAESGDVKAYLERVKNQADEVLEASDLLSHLDLEDELDASQAVDLVAATRDSTEWWALVMGTCASALLDQIDAGTDPALLPFALRMQASHSMLVFKQSLEEHVWTGYTHSTLIYDIASASARTPEDAEKVRALRPLFLKLDEDVLHAWVSSGSDIGPRIGVTDVDEGLLKGLAAYHLSLFERRRQESTLQQEHSTKVWTNRIAAAAVGATIAATIFGVILKLG